MGEMTYIVFFQKFSFVHLLTSLQNTNIELCKCMKIYEMNLIQRVFFVFK